MAHKDQLEFFENFSRLSEAFGSLKIVEIGSLDINGTIRQLFTKNNKIEKYIGVDIGEGKGVDVVDQGHLFLRNQFEKPNIILSAECLEHNPFWKETIAESILTLSSPGIIIFSWATTGRHVHGTHSQSSQSAPFVVEKWNSYYKNVSRRDLMSVKERKLLDYEAIFINHQHKDLYWIGLKSAEEVIIEQIEKHVTVQKDKISQINNSYLKNYKNLLRKALRQRAESAISRLNPDLQKSKWGKSIRNKAKYMFESEGIFFKILYLKKRHEIRRTEFWNSRNLLIKD